MDMSHRSALTSTSMQPAIRTYNITLLIRNDGYPEFCPAAFFHWLHFFFTSSSVEIRRKNNFTRREMKLFSNLVKLSLAPFAVVLGLSEVPLGIRIGFMTSLLKSSFRYHRGWSGSTTGSGLRLKSHFHTRPQFDTLWILSFMRLHWNQNQVVKSIAKHVTWCQMFWQPSWLNWMKKD